MKLGEPDPFTLKILTIILGIVLLMAAGLFLVSALQQWRRNPLSAITSLVFSILLFGIDLICIYVLLE